MLAAARQGSRAKPRATELLCDHSARPLRALRPPPSPTMPPRLSALRAFSSLTSNPTQCLSLFAPLLQQPPQTRAASILAGLSDVPAAYNKRIRRGRGPASGKGKTSGRGHKGQKQHGKVPVGFNGGQTPYEVTHPEKGFVNQYVSASVVCKTSLMTVLR